jgi:hypothetical protein
VAINEADEHSVRELCSSLRGAGRGFGFEPVSVAARDAMRTLEIAESFEGAVQSLRRLVSVCRRLRCDNTL